MSNKVKFKVEELALDELTRPYFVDTYITGNVVQEYKYKKKFMMILKKHIDVKLFLVNLDLSKAIFFLQEYNGLYLLEIIHHWKVNVRIHRFITEYVLDMLKLDLSSLDFVQFSTPLHTTAPNGNYKSLLYFITDPMEMLMSGHFPNKKFFANLVDLYEYCETCDNIICTQPDDGSTMYIRHNGVDPEPAFVCSNCLTNGDLNLKRCSCCDEMCDIDTMYATEDDKYCYRCEQVCRVCDNHVKDEDMGDDDICLSCESDGYLLCCYCEFATNDYERVDGNNYCRSCYDNNFTKCNECSEKISYDDAESTEDGEIFCKDCYKELFKLCMCCDEDKPKDDFPETEDGEISAYCQDCHENYECNICHKNCEFQDDERMSPEHGHVCSECWDNLPQKYMKRLF